MEIHEILREEELQIKKLDALIQKSIHDEQLLTSKLLELELDESPSLGQKLADKVASFGGSWLFIIIFFMIILFWIILNVYLLSSYSFDPYPFILLNLILSCVAALQAPVIMMSQNRQDEKDRRRSRADYVVNLKAEMEIQNLHQKIDILISDEMKTLFKIQQTQLDLLSEIQSAVAVQKAK